MSHSNVAQQLQQAIAHHNAGRLQQAEAGYNQILRQFPNHADALHLLGVVAGQSGRHDVAASLFTRAIAVSPKNVDFHRNLAFSLQSQGNLPAAVESFKQVAALTPYNPDAHFQLGNAQFAAGDFQGAVNSYQKATSIRPTFAEGYCNLGSALVMLGLPDQGIISYQKAVSLNPSYMQAQAMLASTFVEAGQFDAAIAACEKALQMQPNEPGFINLLGNAQKGKGDLDAAMASYQRALNIAPGFAEVLNNLGNVHLEKKEIPKAIECFEKAVQIAPQNPEFHFSLGTALHENKQFEKAIVSLNQALAIRQDDPKVYYNLALALKELSVLREDDDMGAAINAVRKAVALKPDYWQAILNLGICLMADKQYDEAFACFKTVIQLKPDSAEAHNNLGVLLAEQALYDRALYNYQKAIELKPDYVEAYNNEGNAWKEKGAMDSAITCYLRALALDEKNFKVLCSLGTALKETSQSDRAMECYEKAIALKPDDTDVLGGMGGVHLQNGEVSKANQCYRRAIEINPKLVHIYDALLFTSLYDPETSPQSQYIDTQKWNLVYGEPYVHLAKPLANDPNPDRKLRIGYISPDLREHVVSKFVLPLMENHDPNVVEFIGYAEVKKPDAITKRMKSLAVGWHSTVAKTDDEVAEMIRQDRIDILVDLAGHTGGNRLPVFARKPAPVQVNYQGYPATTGVPAVDYRITDVLSDPPGMTEAFHSEQLVRLETSNWAYDPPKDAPEVYPSPAEQRGYVTFCSFNNFAKVNKLSLSFWARILAAAPTARLVIKSKGVCASVPTKNIRRIMAEHGVSEDRVQLLDWMANSDHFSQFANVDVALDSYPYNGTTTTCESLYMGVPVVTLAGPAHVSRVGVSLMTNVGLPELIGHTPEQFIQIACDIANDIPRVVQIRKNLRENMRKSLLMDGATLARGIEAAYRKMWRTWCAKQAESTSHCEA